MANQILSLVWYFWFLREFQAGSPIDNLIQDRNITINYDICQWLNYKPELIPPCDRWSVDHLNRREDSLSASHTLLLPGTTNHIPFHILSLATLQVPYNQEFRQSKKPTEYRSQVIIARSKNDRSRWKTSEKFWNFQNISI